MATAIEGLLYSDRGIHGVSEFTVLPGIIRIRLAPREASEVHTVAVFSEAGLTSVEAYPEGPGDLDMPWDIIGFDCYELGNGRWRFVLHCPTIEWCFESTWPIVKRVGA